MTYKHGSQYCFLFPRAEGDLLDYFEQNPTPKGDLEVIRWLAEQCLRLTEAVDIIHNPPKQDSLQADKRRYGRHGDIKAENILVFKTEKKEDVLVLSDFGLGSMHHDWSRSNIPNRDIAATPIFRPPECEMEGGCISRAFDIWTLGCLFLDLLTWLLGGEDLRQEFERKRTTPYIRGPDTPLYFEVIKVGDERHGFIVKEQVKDWFAEMHHHDQCTPFVHDFLDLIEQKMLVVESNCEKRARTGELLERLRSFHRKCLKQGSEDYCYTPRPNKSRLTIVPTIVEGLLSEVTKDRMKKSNARLRKLDRPTQRAEQIREDGDEPLSN
ncbi:kinase-like domain-containing protein [Daldinia eschscholtzii]|nr:kinase-like domain-containing protein [Daldinia eschscholtzii]